MPSFPAHGMIAPGDKLDRYEILMPIAEGGMAQVWIARIEGKRGISALHAIKTVHRRYLDNPQAHAMFFDEARIAARIRHPNVAKMIEVGEVDDFLYFVLEWVDGDSLSMLRRAV